MKTDASLRYKLFWLWIFGIAMAYLEAAVVVYLRTIYYPAGFAFPLKMIPTNMALVEIGREAMTLVMLLAVAFLAGRNFWQRFSFFMMSFGIWDIFYYLWLKVFLNWPHSLLTWDILYLIPVPWTGPVLAPVLVSLAMIISSFLILNLDYRGIDLTASKTEWGLTVLSALLIFIAFIFDFQNIIRGGMPNPFRWDIFGTGLLLGIVVFARRYALTKKEKGANHS